MTERTNKTRRADASEGRPLTSFRELATALGRSTSTASQWTKHPEWTFSRTAPWKTSDVPAMHAWADANLRRDAIDAPGPAQLPSDFWAAVRFSDPLPSCYADDGEGDPLPLTKWPAEIVGPRERALIAKGLASADPTARLLAAVLMEAVELRAWQLHYAPWIARQLGDQGQREQRLRCWVQDDIVNKAAAIERLIADTEAKPVSRRRKEGA